VILTAYGFREWAMATAAAIAVIVFFGPIWWIMITVAILWLACVAFFRDPLFRKPASNDPCDLVSPADGVVSVVLAVEHHPAIDGPATVVRIFLSVLDVHINRMPCAGTVLSITHTPGRYLDARSEESARVNESNLIVVKTSAGERIGIRQVSGAIARRIVCPISVGDSFTRAQRFGMIKFGSTTELILPTRAAGAVRVKKGDRVVGGVTILATLRPAAVTP